MKIVTLKIKTNAVDMLFMRFNKAEDILLVLSVDDGFCGKLMLITLVCLAIDIALLLLCPSAYN